MFFSVFVSQVGIALSDISVDATHQVLEAVVIHALAAQWGWLSLCCLIVSTRVAGAGAARVIALVFFITHHGG